MAVSSISKDKSGIAPELNSPASSLNASTLPSADIHLRGTPFFEKEVAADYDARFEKAWRGNDNGARDQLAREFLCDIRKRAFVRAEEIVDGLLTLVAKKGEASIEFLDMFTLSSKENYSNLMAEVNTPEARRDLYTLIKSFSEIPKTWARSAWVRLLRGNGKQASDKFNYTGKEMFGVDYGWKQDPLNSICDLMISGRPDYWYVRNDLLANILGTSADVEEEFRAKEEEKGEDNVEYFDARFTVRIEKNKPMIEKMLNILESRGLGPVPMPIEKDPPKPRKVKEFKVGDKITKSNLRDLQLPAIVEVPVLAVSNDGKTSKEEIKNLFWVVENLHSDGTFKCAMLPEYDPNADNSAIKLVAYHEDASRSASSWYNSRRKEFLNGAKFLGKFEGSISTTKNFKYTFSLRLPDGSYAY